MAVQVSADTVYEPDAQVRCGPPLPDEQMKQWTDRRNAVNRYFASLGYTVGGSNGR